MNLNALSLVRSSSSLKVAGDAVPCCRSSRSHSCSLCEQMRDVQKTLGSYHIQPVPASALSPHGRLLKGSAAGWNAESQRLVCSGLQLECGRTLRSYGILDEATIAVLARLAGGAKKRKKKTYTKPKKQKHKPKKIKLRILKYYKVCGSLVRHLQ